jgi:hypothetical protein
VEPTHADEVLARRRLGGVGLLGGVEGELMTIDSPPRISPAACRG